MMATSQILHLLRCCTATLQLLTDQCHFKADMETCRNKRKRSLSECIVSMHGRNCWKRSNIPSTSAVTSQWNPPLHHTGITLASMWTVMLKMQPVIYVTTWSKSKHICSLSIDRCIVSPLDLHIYEDKKQKWEKNRQIVLSFCATKHSNHVCRPVELVWECCMVITGPIRSIGERHHAVSL